MAKTAAIIGEVGPLVVAGKIHVGDRCHTQAVGRWPGGPCVVTRVGPEDPGAPEIVLYVRHDDEAVRKEHGKTMGCFEDEIITVFPKESPDE